MELSQTEKDFQSQVVEAARLHGFLVYHTFDSRRSRAGFPDLVLVKGKIVYFWELKSEKGKVTNDQALWIANLDGCEAHAEVLRPSDWDHIVEMLQRSFR